MSKNSKRCWHPDGCHNKGIKCVGLDGLVGRFCEVHITGEGFCYCGSYAAHLDSFHWGPYKSFCHNCADEYRYQDRIYEEIVLYEEGHLHL